jgi:ornithine decarboxylase
VPYTTFDSLDELKKIAAKCPDVGVVLRIRADDKTARLPFGCKYGALPTEVNPLLAGAVKLGLTVAGVSFHVGSGAGDPNAFRVAIEAARDAWATLVALEPAASFRPMLLDLGGGFAGGFGVDGEAFVGVGSTAPNAVAGAINQALADYFPEADFPAGLKVISEPGRYFAESSSAIVTRVVGRRLRMPSPCDMPACTSSSEEEEECKQEPCAGELHYYISDGIYGAFNAILYDGWLPKAVPFRVDEQGCASVIHGASAVPSTFFGPTCDSLDMVFNRIPSCPPLDVGDYLLFPSGGAYTIAGATDFNGIPATSDGGVRNFYVSSAEFTTSDSDIALPVIYSDEPPMCVKKNFA